MSAEMKDIILSAPFGNYLNYPGCTSTLGTFTPERRRGRVTQFFRTVRYYHRLRSWVNKMGLRNPGIEHLVHRVRHRGLDVSDKIISVHAFTPEGWSSIVKRAARLDPLAIEINVGCPNVGEIMPHTREFYQWCKDQCKVIIVKIPPIGWKPIVFDAYNAGIKYFHACNTLPCPGGGMSGKVLKPVSLSVCEALWREDITVIGGGGISDHNDILDYGHVGCTKFALGTGLICMSKKQRELIVRTAACINRGAAMRFR